MYDWNIFKSTEYEFPLITVGNISAGGTGKSPFVNHLVSLLKDKKKIGVLSRGYGRQTSGFKMVDTTSKAVNVGDEPLQLKQSYPTIEVAVDADRRNGIEKLTNVSNKEQVIILDDAFQHRKVKGGFQIVLTAHYNLYVDDYPLPAGDLREPISAAARANVIIVTKCPISLSVKAQSDIERKLKLRQNQSVYFTSISYAAFVYGYELKIKSSIFFKDGFFLVTGIAEPKPLIEYLTLKGSKFTHQNFPDHHVFSTKEINDIAQHKKILTTQKDYMRLQNEESLRGKLFYLPIEVEFLSKEAAFKKELQFFVDKY